MGVKNSTLDKPYAKKIERVQRHGLGKHHAVAEGINLITLLWTEGDRSVPVDYHLYNKAGDGLTKHDHFASLLKTARPRGFVPACVVFDSGDGRLANLKVIDGWGWIWLTRLEANRLVNPGRPSLRAVARFETDANGTIAHLKDYGLICLFKIVTPNGDIEGWASNALQMSPLMRTSWAGYACTIEHSHRCIKQFCEVECAHVRAARAQRNHLGLYLRAFLRLERYCYHTGSSEFEAKIAIIRPAVQAYLANPLYSLPDCYTSRTGGL